MKVIVCILLVASLLSIVAGIENKKTLVVLDNVQTRNTHSMFFQALEDQGHKLTYSHVFGETIPFQKYGEFFYDNLIIFAPTAEDLGEGLSVSSVIQFIDSGRNVLMAVSRNVTEPLREIANECGLDFDEPETAVIDHVNYDSSDAFGDHTLVASSNFIQSKVILGPNAASGSLAPILFSGIGHAAPNAESSPLIYKVLTGSSSTYSHSPSQKVVEYPQSAGRDTLLVTAIQARNNARVVFSGSLQLFSNQFFLSPVEVGSKKYPRSGNEEFAVELARWNFQGRGLLQASSLKHRLADPNAPYNPQTYRVKDQIEFSVDIFEYDSTTQKWEPFKANDVQLEFVMLDPYIRTTLATDGKGRYYTSFRVPDVYGVYKFVVKYTKLGYTFLELTEQVSVHPFRHNEFERFIPVAYPYYASAFSMMVGFFVFGIVFLYSKETNIRKGNAIDDGARDEDDEQDDKNEQ